MTWDRDYVSEPGLVFFVSRRTYFVCTEGGLHP